MLVNLQEVLKIAEKERYAIGSFNTPNFENIIAVLTNAEKYNIPVIISHAEVHEPIMDLNTIGPVMVDCAKRANVPVCVHLDHGESLDYIERALELGFTSVMYDGSKLSYEDNVSNTLKVVEMARKYNTGVEAEIGVLATDETGSDEGIEAVYTDPEIAESFVKATGIDALAASFGTLHGIYKTKPVLDFDRIKRIKELTGIPLVMHGGSGVSKEDYIKAIECGIRKINYYTYMAREGGRAAWEVVNVVESPLYHDIAYVAVEAMIKDVEEAVKVFYHL